MLTVIFRVAKAIWTGLVKAQRAFTEAKMARAEWEVSNHLRMHGYSNLSEYQKEKLRYYERAHF